ncbi:IS4 family transposase, partial [Candidatus Thiosymbion oneisti]|uniref:IS4 family transposase n=1 Tax=Candidatus Thiosymbion oneisti TaxID=589554 RepID=UPI00210B68E3
MLTFAVVVTLVLRKSVKSLQNLLNEALNWLGDELVTASAFCQARYQLKHTAFIEINEKAVVETLYSDDDYPRYWGFRLLGVDGSKVLLPDTDAVREAFGTIAYSNGKDSKVQGEHPDALASVLYDLCNRVALDARLERADAYEVDLAVAHLEHARPGDLLLADRNDPSDHLLAELSQRGIDFAIRCSAASFKQARAMLRGQGADSQVVTLTPCSQKAADIRRRALPMRMRVRFVRVRLSTGEWEVLVTSLCDGARWPTADFRALYHQRWGVASFYGVLKTRLALANFTGLGPEAVRQDFFATVFLSGLESLLTESAQVNLDAKPTRHPQQVNRAVSFNAIKHNALQMLISDTNIEALCERLTALFMTNPCSQRQDRNPPRRNTSARGLLDFYRRRR